MLDVRMLCPFAHPVTCCWMLLRVVAQSLKPVKILTCCKRRQHSGQRLPTLLGVALLRPFAPSLTRVVQTTAKECTKDVRHVESCLFAN